MVTQGLGQQKHNSDSSQMLMSKLAHHPLPVEQTECSLPGCCGWAQQSSIPDSPSGAVTANSNRELNLHPDPGATRVRGLICTLLLPGEAGISGTWARSSPARQDWTGAVNWDWPALCFPAPDISWVFNSTQQQIEWGKTSQHFTCPMPHWVLKRPAESWASTHPCTGNVEHGTTWG